MDTAARFCNMRGGMQCGQGLHPGLAPCGCGRAPAVAHAELLQGRWRGKVTCPGQRLWCTPSCRSRRGCAAGRADRGARGAASAPAALRARGEAGRRSRRHPVRGDRGVHTVMGERGVCAGCGTAPTRGAAYMALPVRCTLNNFSAPLHPENATRTHADLATAAPPPRASPSPDHTTCSPSSPRGAAAWTPCCRKRPPCCPGWRPPPARRPR